VITKYKPQEFMGVGVTVLGHYDTSKAGWDDVRRYFGVLVSEHGGKISTSGYECDAYSYRYTASVEPTTGVDDGDTFIHEEEIREDLDREHLIRRGK
jgi:hypothetical protein